MSTDLRIQMELQRVFCSVDISTPHGSSLNAFLLVGFLQFGVLEMVMFLEGFPDGTVVKNLPASEGDKRDVSSSPGCGRSPGEGNGNPLQWSCLENPMDRGAWWATVRRVAKSWTQQSDWALTQHVSRKWISRVVWGTLILFILVIEWQVRK